MIRRFLARWFTPASVSSFSAWRITGDTRPSQLIVLNEFRCEKCGAVETIKIMGEQYCPIDPPPDWVRVETYPRFGPSWYCPRHEVKIEDRR